MAGLPFAARSFPKSSFNHKIHVQIRFSQKSSPRCIFPCRKNGFTDKYLRKTDSCNLPVMGSLNTRSPTFHYQHDQGILQETGKPGKGGSTGSQGTMQCFGKQAPAHGAAQDIPGSRNLPCDWECDEDGQAIPADKRPLPRLFALHFFW